MSKVVTVMNMKGGVGKTVVTAHLGGMLARYKFEGKFRKVLLIDYDPQFNLSQMFIAAKMYFELEKLRKTSKAILQDDESDSDPFRLKVPGNHTPPKVSLIAHSVYAPKAGGRIDIVPSTLDLMYLALGQLPARTKVFEERFAKFVAECRQAYDLVLIDCHPAGSLLTKTALDNSDHVLIPVVSGSPFAARGVGLMKRFIESSQAGRAVSAHILFNLAESQSGDEAIIRTDPRYKDNCMLTSLRLYKAFADPTEGVGFVWSSRRPYSTRAFQNLMNVAAEFVKRLAV